MTLTLTFEITLRSDYHVDAGHGLGFGVDAALQRDADGVPVIRGSNVVGLLRGGLERLAALSPLKEYEKDEDGLPERLFGTAEKPKRWYFSSARPVDLEQPLPQNAWHPGHDGAQQVTRVRVNPRTRRAKPHQLFSQEMGDARLGFRFRATCHAADDAALDEAALLVATARYVRQLGGSRRRGAGECVIHLIEVDGADVTEAGFLQRFREAWLDTTPKKTRVLPTSIRQHCLSHPMAEVGCGCASSCGWMSPWSSPSGRRPATSSTPATLSPAGQYAAHWPAGLRGATT
jgi:CRISPR-associated protein Csx10